MLLSYQIESVQSFNDYHLCGVKLRNYIDRYRIYDEGICIKKNLKLVKRKGYAGKNEYITHQANSKEQSLDSTLFFKDGTNSSCWNFSAS